jgi:hypothetical protein
LQRDDLCLLKTELGVEGEITKVLWLVFWKLARRRLQTNSSISESHTDSAGGADQFALRIDGLEMADGMRHVDGDNGIAV